MDKFDVFVFGTGTAGQLVAQECAAAGKKVGIIDIKEYGGVCSQRGCDPKKLLLASSEAFESSKNMNGDGITGKIKINWKDAFNYAKRYTSNIPKNTEKNLKENGIICYHGKASFKDAHTIILDGKEIRSEYFVIATGMQPLSLGIPGEKYTLTSADFFNLTEVPEKVVFVGGGYIGMEFGHMLCRAGSNVTIIDKGDQILSPFETFTSNLLEEESIKMGIKIIKNAQVSSIEKIENRYCVHYAINNQIHQVTTDCVFNTAGRVPSIDKLNLALANVVTDKDGVLVNSNLQSTSQAHIYACGDISSKSLPLTPLSSIEAKVVADNLNGKKRELNIPAIPSSVFTIPQCSGIGLTENEAIEAEKTYHTIESEASEWFNNQRINAPLYGYKIILENDSNKILGAHIVGPEAAEQINMFAIAMKANMTFEELKDVIFNYPTWGNDIKSF
ncbi:dihydrolipoyl dehydrogenase family protein [Nonlabens ulvanivorans]|uniref:Dihydrolipoamide dehydrogenase n=1 Tax=Nonlabens ulvanivorans TaxID=906888 RepID=A0A084JTC3_NONUL|nr:NAD(P)/FAD-dependent oxidoreductase [Nonlabens ulvanivorans]KEZ92207.1 dihydrolipoamide dehydrogenase [Nonlabens ulvanivorans]PRX15036.1 glutathione reductase (NADPH) [Nonlabens ulvanivorans]